MAFSIAGEINFLGASNLFNAAGKPVFVFGAGFSGIIGINAFIKGDDNLAMKSGLDVAASYVMLEGGAYGIVVGGSYFILDGLGYIDPIINWVDPTQQYQRSNYGQ